MKLIDVWKAKLCFEQREGKHATAIRMTRWFAAELLVREKWELHSNPSAALDMVDRGAAVIYNMKVIPHPFTDYYCMMFEGVEVSNDAAVDPHLEKFIKNVQEMDIW